MVNQTKWEYIEGRYRLRDPWKVFIQDLKVVLPWVGAAFGIAYYLVII